ncbi:MULTISPECIES: NAD(P)H-dependent glycerol-3-phosphate dehydrogenase [Actinomadura]|uniref:Glycerol-3-phosphate dehydrogenase [NAD(P)+] n=1 Tax=Actinomadura litoris TaxID=2678616 RepID=A0A7K1LCU2_9ACTN|nr:MULTISPECIES: NAD(P)H-dependent glycerol-3-phosphate dehydrogenase [Actinomadura]MBT2213661.1 NAD(P)-dependent glycerol-3-phosphate dehydrogenase [Actinomadura sp. NEAU-AAG7]MUN42005.1 NAD(P)H-dependent glycerol-3-phosphate dehydrogenase [Actinomadura litoris]
MGSGSWGTTFAKMLHDAGGEVTLWGRRAEVVEAINERHENPDYLPGAALPEAVRATTDPAEALAGVDFVALAVPAQTLRATLAPWVPLLPPGAILVSLMKGVELGTTRRMSEVIREVADVPQERVAVFSGPNLAREIVSGEPSAAVAACEDEDAARGLQAATMTPYFRVYTSTDVIGVELGGAVKNIVALCVGMSVGLGFGANTQALLMTRGLAEIARLGAALGADEHTFAGLAGMGDLVASCVSPLARNRTFGENLGRGMTLDQVTAVTKQTAEGVRSSEAVLELARKHNVEMPITEAVTAVLYHGMPIREAAISLISRAPKPERYGV